ncbi:GM20881 [Drosophila sechellia]|uniref:GM20881 n=1 Tax=Drosophila sechellia TaxID=7238 RepID=B4HPV9_DROSE|nr:GM20881 [Drosophila sechellia]
MRFNKHRNCFINSVLQVLAVNVTFCQNFFLANYDGIVVDLDLSRYLRPESVDASRLGVGVRGIFEAGDASEFLTFLLSEMTDLDHI